MVLGKPGRINQSLNTGVLNFNKYGRRIPFSLSSKVFLHELGHSFGAAVGNPSMFHKVTLNFYFNPRHFH